MNKFQIGDKAVINTNKYAKQNLHVYRGDIVTIVKLTNDNINKESWCIVDHKIGQCFFPADELDKVTNNKLFEILVPTTHPSGKPIHTRFHKVWDAKIREISGGLTILTPIKGQWVNNQNLIAECMIPVRIMCEDSQMDEIVKLTAKYYSQQSIMYYEISSKVFIKEF